MLTRRGFLAGSVSAVAACASRSSTKRTALRVTHGVQAGIVDGSRAIVWARCDESARMVVEWDTTERFANPRRFGGPTVTPDGDLCGTLELADLPAGQTIAYRVRFEREAARGESAWTVGRFATPRTDTLRVAWTGDTCGQGYGRSPDFDGLLGYKALRDAQPHLFINSGDLIYADNPIPAEQRIPDTNRVWKNITNERVARVAESLDDFRARFAYNFEDDHLRNFAAAAGSIVQWDDHETHNNWYPGQTLADERYEERDASRLAALARRAMFEWSPLAPRSPIHRVVPYGPLVDVFVLDCRTFRSANDAGTGTQMLGAAQAQWLVDSLAASKARWKLIACDQPISVLVGETSSIEGFANGAAGPPVGREIELAALLVAMKQRGVKNAVWVTADVHYAAATHFDPARGAVADFDPFWEFIAGPIHAGTFGPEVLDTTFGAEVKFQWVPPAGTGNLPPSDGIQSFGTIDVAPEALTVTLWGIDGKPRHKLDIPFTAA